VVIISEYLQFIKKFATNEKILLIIAGVIYFSVTWPLGLIQTRHFDAQYCDIAIKRYCNKKIKRHFSTNIFFHLWIENIFFFLFETILQCNYNILKKKYLFIAILCAKMSRVNKALREDRRKQHCDTFLNCSGQKFHFFFFLFGPLFVSSS